MPKMEVKYGAGEAVDILMGENAETDWRRGTVYKAVSRWLYQVNVPGYGYIMKRENELRKVDADADKDGG